MRPCAAATVPEPLMRPHLMGRSTRATSSCLSWMSVKSMNSYGV